MPEPSTVDMYESQLIRHVFFGKLDNLPSLASKIVRIFTSSTFTDTSMERNSLMQHTYPKLKEYCREKYGLEFQVVDMRWGVRDEATDDHKTTELCMQEIDNCQRVSVGPNFVVFLAQKYGYRPLPTKIEEGEFRMVLSVSSPEDDKLLNQWYKLDTNHVPSLFCLQPVSSIFTNFTNKAHPRLMEEDQSQWWETMGKLNRAVRVAAAALLSQGRFTHQDNHRYNWSVTEQEVVRGILNAKDTVDHTLAFFRHIENINIGLFRHSMKFIDIASKQVDEEAQRMLSDLRDVRVPAVLPESSIIRYTVQWSDEEGLNKTFHAEYLQNFIETFYTRLVELIDRGVGQQKSLATNRAYSEVLQHLHVVNNFSQDFQGRNEILERAYNYIQGPSKQPLVLWGDGGCGKSSMLAKIVTDSEAWFAAKNCPVVRIVRFLGTTPESSSIGPLLRSVCQQINSVYEIPDTGIPVELSQLILHFKRLLEKITADKPLCIYFDSLDQLSSADGAHSMSWLPPTLPNNVKLIVSTLPGIYNILNTLRNIIDSTENFIQTKPLGVELGKTVLKAWLARNRRTISDQQWELVHERLTECSIPLYVKLVYDEIKLWKSFTKVQEKDLAKTISTSIHKLLGRVENQHGHILVGHAFSYITASKSGLSEAELEDLISLDETVLNDIYQYHLPPIRRIPPLLWTRIRNDIPSYLVEREAEGVSVVSWYHRQFAEVSRERYLSNPEACRGYHSSMADYYLGIWATRPKPFQFTENQKRMFNIETAESEADRKVPAQPIIFVTTNPASMPMSTPTVRYNLRKLSELPFQLMRAQREDDLYTNVLFNYDFLHAKLSSMPLNLCIFDYEDALEYAFDKEVKLVGDALRLSSSVLASDPNNLACQVIGRLFPFYTTCPKIASLIDQCESTGLKVMGLVPAFNTLASPGGPLVYSLEAHQFAVYGLEVISSGQSLLTVSNKFIVFDLSSGDIVRTIDPRIEGIMTYLAISPDQRYCSTTTIGNQYIICNLLTGDYILRDFQPPASFLSANPAATKVTNKSNSGQPADPLLGASVSNKHFAIWTAKIYQVFTNKAELLTTQATRFQIVHLEVLEGPQIELVCRTEDVKEDQDVPRDRLLIDYCFVPTNDNKTDSNNTSAPPCSLIGGRKNIHSALVITRDKKKMYTCSEINDYNIEMYVNKPHPLHPTTQRVWAFDHQLYENRDRIFALILSQDENYLMAVTFKGFKIFSFLSYLWKTCSLPGAARNIVSGVKRLTYTAAFSQDNRYCIACVKSTVYVFELEWGDLVASLDYHFGRILVVKCVSTGGGNNYVITAGIDKTTKVWNLQNAKEKTISTPQLDKCIEMMHISTDSHLILAQSRTQLCMFDMRTGVMTGQLSINPHGSIYQCSILLTNGLFAASAESGNVVLYDIEERKTAFVTPLKNVFQLMLHSAETMILALTTEPSTISVENATMTGTNNIPVTGNYIRALSFGIPDGDMMYEIISTVKRINNPKKAICTADDTYFVFIEEKKNHEVLSLYDPMTGEYIHSIRLNYPSYKDITMMVTIPKQPFLIGLIDSEKGIIMNVRDKKVHFTIPKWGGQISSDGKYGLYAPTRGGLEIFDFRNAKVVRTLIGKIAEGVFDVLAFFTPTNEHVVYYHKGKRTIRLFRTEDGRQLADIKCPAKVRQAFATHDGRALVVGYEDGAIQMFLIVDYQDESHIEYLKSWRKYQVKSQLQDTQQETTAQQPELTT